jgi:hypothetical protein
MKPQSQLFGGFLTGALPYKFFRLDSIILRLQPGVKSIENQQFLFPPISLRRIGFFGNKAR